jgi:hypothetical protein
VPVAEKVLDFTTLVNFGGRERTWKEYGELRDEAGFRLSRIVSTASPLSRIEEVPD